MLMPVADGSLLDMGLERVVSDDAPVVEPTDGERADDDQSVSE